jgi:hypothetical protein
MVEGGERRWTGAEEENNRRLRILLEGSRHADQRGNGAVGIRFQQRAFLISFGRKL